MRALWLAAPLALTRYAAVFVAVMLAVALAAASAASTPFVRAAVQSSSLRNQVETMSPLAAGLEVQSGGPAVSDPARRRGAVEFARGLPFSGAPVLTSMFGAQLLAPEGASLQVILMARTDALAHVGHLTTGDPNGVWIARSLTKGTGLRSGGRLTLANFGISARPAEVRLPIAGIYRNLDGDPENPYWWNFTQDIQPQTPDSPLPPTFVFVPEATLLRVAARLGGGVENRFEFPVATRHLTFVAAERLERQYARLKGPLAHGRTGQEMGCGPCRTTSSLDSALLIARADVAAVSATITLLSACALAIAVLIAAAAGIFLVRRRADEAQLLFARGESAIAFGVRTALEALLPALAGGGLGYGAAIGALGLFAPAGTIDHGTVLAGAWSAVAAGAVALAAVTLAAAASFPRRGDRDHPALRHLRRVPWELLPLAGAAAVLGLLLAGSGLASDATGRSHPSIAVFLLPVFAAAGLAGLAARLGRRGLRNRDAASVPVFLMLRRLAAARGLLIAVAVSTTTAVAVFAYAATLSASLQRTAAEKAFVSNGSDVQGVVDPRDRILSPLPFPAIVAQIDASDVFLADGRPVNLVAADTARLGRVIRWGPWPDDPRRRLSRLEHAEVPAGTLAAIASPSLPHTDAIFDQGARIPIRVVGRAPFPGMSAGRAAVLVSDRALRAVAAFHHISDPGPGPSVGGVVWAKGDPAVIEPALRRSSLRPTFLTLLDDVRNAPSVAAGERSYRYLKAIGAAAVVLALLALLLYLQARQRGQLIASALLRRMGLGATADTAALAAEAASIVLAAGVVSVALAVAAARVVVPHVDPLPQYAPGTVVVYPWLTFLWVGTALLAVTAVFAAVAVWAAGRSNVAEALRVA